MARYEYMIAYKSSDPVSFGPGPDGEDQIAPIVETVPIVFETLEEACEYLDSTTVNAWETSTPFIIKTLYSPRFQEVDPDENIVTNKGTPLT